MWVSISSYPQESPVGVSHDYTHSAVREPEAQRGEAAHLRSSSQQVLAPVLEHGPLSVLF